MVQFISRRKADFGKAALFVALYACINICLVSLLKEGLCTGQRILDTKSQKLDVKKLNK